MLYKTSPEEAPTHTGAVAPQEALFVRYVSTLTGHTYDEDTVGHLADMLLIFYAAGGTVLGALAGGALSIPFLVPGLTPIQFALVVLSLVFLGALTVCGVVMTLLNLRGLVRWENYIVKRTATLKKASPSAGQQQTIA